MKETRKILLFLMLFTASAVCAQQRTVSGVVVEDDSDNSPLPGATVTFTKSGERVHTAVSDVNGKFSATVSGSADAMTVSYLGYEPCTVKLVAEKDYYKVVLTQEAEAVSEVVVTGYQKIDRRKLTASISTLKISDETVGAVTNIDQALSGQIAGLSSVTSTGAPGAPVKIRIRGTASIYGTQEPLWVLDGIPMEGTDIPAIDDLKDIDNIYQTSIAGLSPSDIETITVLKDAAATAIYGARAANGVIVITTKKGKEGKPTVNFSGKLTFSPKANIDRLNLLNSSEKVDLELGLLASDYTYRENKGGVANILSALGETQAYKNGGWEALSPAAQAQINQLRQNNTDWNDILFRNTLNKEYNVSLSGGSDRADYYTSVGYTGEEGNVESVGSHRYNITLKTNYRINSLLKVGASVFANERKQKSYLTDTNGFTNPVYYSRLANSYFLPYAEDGSYNYDTNVQGKETSSLDFNIFEERANSESIRRDRSVMAIFDAELRINHFLTLTSQFGYQLDSYSLSKYAGESTYAMRQQKLNTEYVQTDGSRKSFLPDGGMHKTTEYHSNQWTWKAQAEYNQTFGNIHNVGLMLGTEVRHSNDNSIYSVAYGYDRRTLTVQPVVFPSQSWAESYPLHQETETENAYVSWFATGSYTFNHRYTFGGSVRFDGSDVFGVAKKYRYLPLYSVSGLWRIKEEKPLKDISWLDNLALRASYGLQGNIDKSTSPYLIGTFDRMTILPGVTEDVIKSETAPNPDLKWEKTENVNVGLDVAVLGNAVTLTVDYYHRHSSDLIGMKMLPLETGFASTSINWATMNNDGVEIALGTRNIHTRDFTWMTNINIGFNSNKVIKETVAQNATYPSREGYPVGALFALKTAGLDSDGYPLFLTKDGQKVSATELLKLNAAGASTLSAEEQRNLYTYMGTTDPKVAGGFINTFKYKDWQLGINFTYNLGMKVRVQPSYNPANFDRGLNTNRDILSRWTADNTSGKFAKLMTSSERPREYVQYNEYNLYSMLDTWIRDCNYIRLQSLRLGYKLPAQWTGIIGIKSASLSLEARNIFVIASDYNNYLDPETMGNPYAQPIAKSFIFGVNVNF